MMRRAIQVILVLLIGFVLNGIVALGLMCRSMPRMSWFSSGGRVPPSVSDLFDIRAGEVIHGNRRWAFARYDRFGTTVIGATSRDVPTSRELYLRALAPPRPPRRLPEGVPPVPQDDAKAPAWSLLHRPPTSRRDQIEWRLLEESQGWPLRSFFARYINEPRRIGDSQLNIADGLPANQLPISRFGLSATAWPTSPIWSGIVGNTLFYAILVILLWRLPFAIRRWKRRRAGFCTHCGYDLRADMSAGCPECGWNRGEHPVSN